MSDISDHRDHLDPEEQAVYDRLLASFDLAPPWNDFENRWTATVCDLYESRGVPSADMLTRPLYKLAQSLGSRLAVAQGNARMPDYRDQIADLVRRRFGSQAEFCRATGITEDMLSHVLARRKHMAIDTLTEALAKVGYAVRIVPTQDGR